MQQRMFGKQLVKITIERIRLHEPPEGYYVAFSGGKDSCVILDLVKRSGCKFDAHYSLTTIDPPELVWFIKRQHPEVEWERPKKPFLTMLLKKGFPTRTVRWCCSEYKETGGKGRKVVTGIRRAESVKRSRRAMSERCMRHKTTWYLHPIIDWSTSDVWAHIRKNKIPYCSLYDEGFARLGCLFCPMQSAGARRRQIERYPRWAALFRRAFQRLYDRGENRTAQRWNSAEEMWDWWIDSKRPLPPRRDARGESMFAEEDAVGVYL